MGESYPRRDQARGLWNIKTITNNIIEEGTYPQTSNQNTAIYGGGDAPSTVTTIDTVQINTTGNATDFGDLIAAASNPGANGSFIRGIYSNGYVSGSNTNTIQYVHFKSQGNMADFGDSTISGRARSGGGNNIRSIYGGGFVSGNVNTIDFITNATTGNATDFGDRTESRNTVGGAANTTRFLMAGGSSPSTTIDFVEISSTGNAVDFGDLTAARLSAQAFASATRCVFAGGQPAATVDFVEFGSLGNAVDFGDLAVDVAYQGTTSNSIRGIVMGGSATPNDSTKKNEIQMISIASRANATDFGDLTAARNNGYSCSNGHGGLQEFHPRAPELYSPTGKVVPSGLGLGDIGIFNGGEAPGNTNVIDFIQISNIGNASDFGDLTAANAIGGAVSSATRYVTIGDNDSNLDTHYLEFRSKGNTAFFGDLTVRGYAGAGGSSSTRGINYGRANPATSGTANETIDYITTATIGNWTDFGNCNVASYFNGGTNSSTRMVKCGGITEGPATITDSMEYVTIGSTGNGTDFGDLSASNGGFSCGNVSNGTRGIFGGGSVNPNNNTPINVIQYITIASTSNTTDFGDLTVARRYCGSSCNSTRGVWAGGEAPSNSNTMDYVTIASTGNAIDYGDLTISVSRHGGASNGHGGLS